MFRYLWTRRIYDAHSNLIKQSTIQRTLNKFTCTLRKENITFVSVSSQVLELQIISIYNVLFFKPQESPDANYKNNLKL